MLYAVVTPEEKYKVKNFIDTMVYRTSDFIAVWSIRMLSFLGVSGVAVFCIPLALAWTGIALWIGREYKRLDELPDAQENA
jgi:AAA family ATP:ADP antiporter